LYYCRYEWRNHFYIILDCTPPFVVRIFTNALTDNAIATTANIAYSRGKLFFKGI
jgi:hypothetical protein